VSLRATKELYGQGKNFDNFVAFDKAKCTVPGCPQLHWNPYGYVVGCSPNDNTRVSLPGAPVWYSLPGTCPSKYYFQKTAECNAAEPGGLCAGEVTGSRNCTYKIEKAGEIRLDELSGIENYNDVWRPRDNENTMRPATRALELPSGMARQMLPRVRLESNKSSSCLLQSSRSGLRTWMTSLVTPSKNYRPSNE